jgi:uncharacterized protein (DUF1778 family)
MERKTRSGSETRRKQSRLVLRCTPQQRKAWEREARLEGMPLSFWVRRLLDQRAEQALSDRATRANSAGNR